MTRFKASRIAIAVVLGTLTLTAPAFAHDKAMMNDRVEGRIHALHDKLHITAAQEPQWKKVAHAMRQNERAVHQLAEARHANKSATAVEDLKSYEKIADEHAAGLKRLIPAFSALYDTMSASQKENADALFGKFEGHEHHRKSGDNTPPNQSK